VSGAVYATTFSNPSDRRLKSNIASLDTRAQHIFSLNGVSFNYKRRRSDGFVSADGAVDKNSTHFGFIAQEVEGRFPELVGRASDGMRSVQYSAFVPLIIEGMKGQRAEAVAQQKMQRAEMDALRAQMDRVSTVVSVKGLTGTGAVTGPLDHLISVKGLSGTGAVTARHNLFSDVSAAVRQTPPGQVADANLISEVEEAYEKVASVLKKDVRTLEIAQEARHKEHDAKSLTLESEIEKLSSELAGLRDLVSELLKKRSR